MGSRSEPKPPKPPPPPPEPEEELDPEIGNARRRARMAAAALGRKSTIFGGSLVAPTGGGGLGGKSVLGG